MKFVACPAEQNISSFDDLITDYVTAVNTDGARLFASDKSLVIWKLFLYIQQRKIDVEAAKKIINLTTLVTHTGSFIDAVLLLSNYQPENQTALAAAINASMPCGNYVTVLRVIYNLRRVALSDNEIEQANFYMAAEQYLKGLPENSTWREFAIIEIGCSKSQYTSVSLPGDYRAITRRNDSADKLRLPQSYYDKFLLVFDGGILQGVAEALPIAIQMGDLRAMFAEAKRCGVPSSNDFICACELLGYVALHVKESLMFRYRGAGDIQTLTDELPYINLYDEVKKEIENVYAKLKSDDLFARCHLLLAGTLSTWEPQLLALLKNNQKVMSPYLAAMSDAYKNETIIKNKVDYYLIFCQKQAVKAVALPASYFGYNVLSLDDLLGSYVVECKGSGTWFESMNFSATHKLALYMKQRKFNKELVNASLKKIYDDKGEQHISYTFLKGLVFLYFAQGGANDAPEVENLQSAITWLSKSDNAYAKIELMIAYMRQSELLGENPAVMSTLWAKAVAIKTAFKEGDGGESFWCRYASARFLEQEAEVLNNAEKLAQTGEYYAQLSAESTPTVAHPRSSYMATTSQTDTFATAMIATGDLRIMVTAAMHYLKRKPSGIIAEQVVLDVNTIVACKLLRHVCWCVDSKYEARAVWSNNMGKSSSHAWKMMTLKEVIAENIKVFYEKIRHHQNANLRCQCKYYLLSSNLISDELMHFDPDFDYKVSTSMADQSLIKNRSIDRLLKRKPTLCAWLYMQDKVFYKQDSHMLATMRNMVTTGASAEMPAFEFSQQVMRLERENK